MSNLRIPLLRARVRVSRCSCDANGSEGLPRIRMVEGALQLTRDRIDGRVSVDVAWWLLRYLWLLTLRNSSERAGL